MFDTVIELPYILCLLFSGFAQFFHFYFISKVYKGHPLTELKVTSLTLASVAQFVRTSSMHGRVTSSIPS